MILLVAHHDVAACTALSAALPPDFDVNVVAVNEADAPAYAARASGLLPQGAEHVVIITYDIGHELGAALLATEPDRIDAWVALWPAAALPPDVAARALDGRLVCRLVHADAEERVGQLCCHPAPNGAAALPMGPALLVDAMLALAASAKLGPDSAAIWLNLRDRTS